MTKRKSKTNLTDVLGHIDIEGERWYQLNQICGPLRVDLTYAMSTILPDHTFQLVEPVLVLQPKGRWRGRGASGVAVVNTTGILTLFIHSHSSRTAEIKGAIIDKLTNDHAFVVTAYPMFATALELTDENLGKQTPITLDDVKLWRKMRDGGKSLNAIAAQVGRSRGTIATYTKNGPHLPKNIRAYLDSL